MEIDGGSNTLLYSLDSTGGSTIQSTPESSEFSCLVDKMKEILMSSVTLWKKTEVLLLSRLWRQQEVQLFLQLYCTETAASNVQSNVERAEGSYDQ